MVWQEKARHLAAGAVLLVASAVSLRAPAQESPAPSPPGGATPSPLRWGFGAAIGPGNVGPPEEPGWWTRVFVAARLRLGGGWSSVLETGLAHGWSSVEGKFTHDAFPGNGAITFREYSAPLSQEYRVTAVLAHVMLGYDFGPAFGLRAGPFVGYGVGTMHTDNCGQATHRGVPAGVALVPTFRILPELEVGLHAEVGFMPRPICAQPRASNQPILPGQDARLVPRVEQNPDAVISAMLRLAYVGF